LFIYTPILVILPNRNRPPVIRNKLAFSNAEVEIIITRKTKAPIMLENATVFINRFFDLELTIKILIASLIITAIGLFIIFLVVRKIVRRAIKIVLKMPIIKVLGLI
jgi:hypothetical protein